MRHNGLNIKWRSLRVPAVSGHAIGNAIHRPVLLICALSSRAAPRLRFWPALFVVSLTVLSFRTSRGQKSP
jgi:hypothetical protein